MWKLKIIYFLLPIYYCDGLVTLKESTKNELNKYHFEEETGLYVLIHTQISVPCVSKLNNNNKNSSLKISRKSLSEETQLHLHNITWMDTEEVKVILDYVF